MNVRQYVLVNVQLVIWFQSSISHTTLATRNLLGPAHCIQQRITHKERSTSHFTLEEVGWFSDMAASRLPEYSLLVVSRVNGNGDWSMLQASSATVSHVLGQTNAAGMGIISQGDS